jgi:nucleoside-diphosphate-sugar epimerase
VPGLADSKILVTGGAGFIGSHVVEQLLGHDVAEVTVLDNFVRGSRSNLEAVEDDPRLNVVDGTIEDTKLLRRLCEGRDYVFHLAALWLHECVHEPRRAIDVNVGGTFNVVEAAHAAGVRKVVYSSSASVYGDALETPMTEDHPFNNRTLYGATKIAGEQFFRAFNEQHGLEWIGLRYMNVYGPRMDDRGAYVSVIVKVLDRIAAGERPLIFGDGSQAYDFVHVRDVSRANVLALQAGAGDDAVNVGTGAQTTIAELVDLLLALTGSDLEPEHLSNEQMFVRNRVGSTETAEELLGFRAEISLEEGLRSVIDWWRESTGAVAADRG